jgi:hypothetical protein
MPDAKLDLAGSERSIRLICKAEINAGTYSGPFPVTAKIRIGASLGPPGAKTGIRSMDLLIYLTARNRQVLMLHWNCYISYEGVATVNQTKTGL